MAVFLSNAWIVELDAAARAAELPKGSWRHDVLTIEQVVCGAPAGDVRYQVRFADGTMRVDPGSPGVADVVVQTDYVIARDMHAGALSAQDALVTGRFKVQGNPDVLVRHADVFEALDDVFAAVRARTTFP